MMKTTAMLSLALGLLATPAFAGKRPVKRAPAAPKAVIVAPLPEGLQVTTVDTNLAFGDSYEIFDRSRDIADSKGTEPTLKIKTDSPLNAITPQRLADIQYCWDRLPAARRAADTTATIKLAIEPIGTVSIATVTGDHLHVELKKCIVASTDRWRFPVADEATEIEYAIALKTTKLAK